MMRIAVYFCVIAALLLFPQICAQSAREALTIWGLHVIPTLFPYMVISKMLTNQVKKTRFPPSAMCLLLGLFGGSPTGASTILSCSSHLSGKSILALCAFSGTISPMFFLGTLRNWTAETSLSSELLFSHIAGAALSAACVYLFSKKPLRTSSADYAKPDQSNSPISESIDAILQVGGCIICFSVAAGLLRLLPLPEAIIPIFHALLEISGGTRALLESPFSLPIKKFLLAFACGFSGCSMLFQNLLFLKPLGVQPYKLFQLAIIRGGLSALILAFVLMF